MSIEIPKDKWSGSVRTITIGATAADGGTRKCVVTVGGQKAMPFLHFENEFPHRPVIAIEIRAHQPDDWSPVLMETWGAVMGDPGEWAKAAEAAGADLIQLTLSLTDAQGQTTTADEAVKAVKTVLGATGLVLGICEDKNYRTIVATAMANGHLVDARTAMDVNLAKQLNILITDMGLPPDRILMDPTTGALGYGIEYGFSVMERLRLAALQGDGMTQLPMLVTPGFEAWKTKEAKVGEGVPESWGDWVARGIHWETITAMTLLESGADIIVLRHPESVKRVRNAIDALMAVPQLA